MAEKNRRFPPEETGNEISIFGIYRLSWIGMFFDRQMTESWLSVQLFE